MLNLDRQILCGEVKKVSTNDALKAWEQPEIFLPFTKYSCVTLSIKDDACNTSKMNAISWVQKFLIKLLIAKLGCNSACEWTSRCWAVTLVRPNCLHPLSAHQCMWPFLCCYHDYLLSTKSKLPSLTSSLLNWIA